jgi:acetylglutamate kinase
VKIVIKVGSSVMEDAHVGHTFPRAVGELVHHGHSIAIVHGCRRQREMAPVRSIVNGSAAHHLHDNGNAINGNAANLQVADCERLNKSLVSLLGQEACASFGIFPSNGRMIRIRRKDPTNDEPAEFEAVAVDPFWLDVISKNGGVPVIASVVLGYDQHSYCINADHMAATCAAGWDADALIFLTRSEGIKTSGGAVLRWLETGDIHQLTKSGELTENMLSKVLACCEALRHGVRRTRLLPVSHVDDLSSFYFSRIEGGTEVICTDAARYSVVKSTS